MPYINKLHRFKQDQVVRLEIVSQLYKRGYSYREIQQEVRARLGIDRGYSLKTVHKDVNCLLEEWRSTRIENIDHSVQLELERIDEVIKEAWQAWEKSKNDYERKKAKQQRIPMAEGEDGEGGSELIRMEQQREEVICYGDPRYLDIIHKNACERRKLLGLYSPEKKDINGEISFANFLMQTGVIDAEE